MASVSSLEEAAAILQSATAGGGRVRIGEDLDAGGMRRVLEHEAGDLTCTVEAGIRLSELAAALGPSGQRLSLDPPGDPTIGACLAQSLSGPLRHRFGAPRDLVLGVTLVLADGTIVNAGGKVVKNVAGYDLGKLVCGSRGRLAFIGRVSLRLHPAPVAAGTVMVESVDAASVVATLLGGQLVPSALDILHPGRVLVPLRGGSRSGRRPDRSDDCPGGRRRSRRDGMGRVAASGRRPPSAGRPSRRATSGRSSTGPREAVVRPAAGVAFLPAPTPTESPSAVLRLQERVRERFDPAGVLA